VPSDVSLRTEIIRLTHDVPHMGHPGIKKTIELISQNYRWLSLRREVTDYVKTCLPCQQTKIFPSKVTGLLNLLPTSKEPWEQVTADFIVELPESQGYDAVLVAADWHTKRVHFIPLVSSVSAEGSVRLFRDHMWKYHSWAKKIITDRGTQFAARFMRALNQLLGMETALSTAYHPQMDGQMERINQELEQFLWLYVNHMQTDWADWLPVAEFAYNNWEYSATSFSLFYLEYGRHPHIPTAPESPTIDNPTAEDFAGSLSQAQHVAYDALCDSAISMKRFTDRKRRESPSYAVGQKVWLDAQNLQTECWSKKLDLRRLGPFEVLTPVPQDSHNPSAYQLVLPTSWKVHPVFHVSLLRPMLLDERLHPPVMDDTQPLPDIINSEEEFEVEAILGHRGGKR
jgi:hypothetical protein